MPPSSECKRAPGSLLSKWTSWHSRRSYHCQCPKSLPSSLEDFLRHHRSRFQLCRRRRVAFPLDHVPVGSNSDVNRSVTTPDSHFDRHCNQKGSLFCSVL